MPDELDPGAIHRAFARAGHRPEVLGAAGDALAFDLISAEGSSTRRLTALIDREIETANTAMLEELASLTTIQSAVLRELATAGKSFAPFEAATLQRYATRMSALSGEPDAPAPPVTSVQRALTGLQKRGLVWRAVRGVYALEDTHLADVMAEAGLLEL